MSPIFRDIFTTRVRSTREGVFTGVCLLTFQRGVPHPRSRWGGTPSSWWGGVPHPRSRQGVPHPAAGAGGGVPHTRSRWWGGRGTPSQVQAGGTPLAKTGWGTSYPGLDGVTPPPPPIRRQQHSEHLLRSRWYASCVHAGGLSCFFSFRYR